MLRHCHTDQCELGSVDDRCILSINLNVLLNNKQMINILLVGCTEHHPYIVPTELISSLTLSGIFKVTDCYCNRKSVEAELTELLDLNQKQIEAMEAAQRQEDRLEDEASLDIYCTVDELREKVNQFPTSNSTFVRNSINKLDNNNSSATPDKRDALQEISLNRVSTAELGCAAGLFVLQSHEQPVAADVTHGKNKGLGGKLI